LIRLKFATTTFLPALADPFTFIYQKTKLDQDPHWYEKNILGSGPFKFVSYETGQSITGVRNPDYYHPGLPYLDGFTGIYAAKQATRLDAIRGDRAAAEFRGLPPSARDELKAALGDQITAQEIAGFLPDIEKSRAEARRLLKEAGAEGLSFELLNRNVDQPYKYVGTWLVDEWSKVGLKATQRVQPTGPWTDAMRRGDFEVVLQANCRAVPNPILDVQPYLPSSVFTANYGNFEDKDEVALYGKMLHETDPARQRAMMREFEKHSIDTQAHEIWVSW